MTPAERIARRFHSVYEKLAPQHGYETRRESAVDWDDVPKNNRDLMVATVSALLADDTIQSGRQGCEGFFAGWQCERPAPHAGRHRAGDAVSGAEWD